MNWLRKMLTGSASPVAAQQQIVRKPPKITAEHVVRASVGRNEQRVKVFTTAHHPPGVAPSGMAMDSAPIGQGWASSAFSAAGVEGISFLGYPVLAEMAQRPEYRVMVETVANECTRRWIRFTSKDGTDNSDRISELEAEFKRLDVRRHFQRATEVDGFFGRGHLLIDTGDGDNPDEMATPIGDGWNAVSRAKIKKGSIKRLRVIEPVWVAPAAANYTDPLAPDWYKPITWYVMSRQVHATRLLTFIGREVPDLLKPAYSFGGLSVPQMAKPSVDNWLSTRQGVNDIITAFSTFVLYGNLAISLEEGGDQIFRRAEFFNRMRDNRGLMIIDKDTEEFQNVSAPLSGLEGLQAQAQEHMASVSHIPTVKLLGIQPAGLNASSEGELRSFYDWIHSYQEHLYREPLHCLMGLVMLSLWGKTDDAIDFEFEPLWSLDEKAQAEVDKIRADTDQVLIDVGALSPEESRSRVARDPQSDYSSIDVNDVPDLREEEESGLMPRGSEVADAALNRLFDAQT